LELNETELKTDINTPGHHARLAFMKVLIGNLEATTKEFARWRVNQMIEEDRTAARRDGDWRAVASIISS
jgi:hypothetical protein